MNWITHTTFILITAVIPAISISSMQKLKRISAWQQIPDLTLNNYVSALLLWILAIGASLVWIYQGGELADFGLVEIDAIAILTSLALILLSGLIVYLTRRRIVTNANVRKNFLQSMESVIAILPRTRRERNSFFLLSFSAGVCEEILYRGFVFAYLSGFMDTVAVVVISSILFGMAHTYQGVKGVPQTGLVGLALAILYLLTGSLWASMVLHAAIDMGYGYLAWQAHQIEIKADTVQDG